MQISDMKRSLFGFRTEDVYRCIDEMSREYADKQRETTEEYKKRIAELEAQLSAAQATLSGIEEENKRLKANEAVVANAVIDAKAFAETMRTNAQAQATELRQSLMKQYLVGKEEAEKVLDSVIDCKKTVAAQLENMKGMLETVETQVQSVIVKESENIDNIEQCSRVNPLSLFLLNKGE